MVFIVFLRHIAVCPEYDSHHDKASSVTPFPASRGKPEQKGKLSSNIGLIC